MQRLMQASITRCGERRLLDFITRMYVRLMGSNRRYADKIDRQTAAKIAQIDIAPKYRSLPPELTEVDKDRPVEASEPIAVTAWIDVTAGTIPIEAVVREWNRKAARIEWKTNDGSQHSAWVYLGAIRRR